MSLPINAAEFAVLNLEDARSPPMILYFATNEMAESEARRMASLNNASYVVVRLVLYGMAHPRAAEWIQYKYPSEA